MTGVYQFLKKYGVAIGFGTGTVLSILMYVIIVTGYPPFNPSNEELYKLLIFDFGLYTSYILILIAVILVASFSGLYVAKNAKESIKGLVSFGIIVLLFIVTYSMGDGALTAEIVNSDPTLLPINPSGDLTILKEGVTQSSGLQTADGLIKFGYIMMILACTTMVLAAGRDFVKQS
jgi:hypothetical protein